MIELGCLRIGEGLTRYRIVFILGDVQIVLCQTQGSLGIIDGCLVGTGCCSSIKDILGIDQVGLGGDEVLLCGSNSRSGGQLIQGLLRLGQCQLLVRAIQLGDQIAGFDLAAHLDIQCG